MKISQTWADAHVQSLRDLTPTVREFTIRPAGGAMAHAPGSHLQVQLLVGGQPQMRSYSLVGEPDGEAYRIAVKRLDDGKGGSLAMWQLAQGDRLRVSEPQNHFSLAWDAPAYLLVAGGIGITPLVGMARALAARGAPVRMLYAARSGRSWPMPTPCALPWAMRCTPAWARASTLPPKSLCWRPAPSCTCAAPRPCWTQHGGPGKPPGRPEADLRYETFGSSGRFAPQAFRVQIPRHALDITVPAGCSLLDALEGAGVQTLSDCRRGECGLCAMDVVAVDGTIDHRDVYLSEHERQANSRICACVSRVVGSVTLDTAWRPDKIIR
jgi:ferredoxin